MTEFQLNAYAPLQPGKVTRILVLIPPAKQQTTITQQSLANTPGQCAALCDTLKVAQQGQGAWPQLPTGNPRSKRPMVFAPTAAADTAQSHVLAHDGLNLGQLQDLVAHRFIAIDFDG